MIVKIIVLIVYLLQKTHKPIRTADIKINSIPPKLIPIIQPSEHSVYSVTGLAGTGPNEHVY